MQVLWPIPRAQPSFPSQGPSAAFSRTHPDHAAADETGEDCRLFHKGTWGHSDARVIAMVVAPPAPRRHLMGIPAQGLQFGRHCGRRLLKKAGGGSFAHTTGSLHLPRIAEAPGPIAPRLDSSVATRKMEQLGVVPHPSSSSQGIAHLNEQSAQMTEHISKFANTTGAHQGARALPSKENNADLALKSLKAATSSRFSPTASVIWASAKPVKSRGPSRPLQAPITPRNVVPHMVQNLTSYASFAPFESRLEDITHRLRDSLQFPEHVKTLFHEPLSADCVQTHCLKLISSESAVDALLHEPTPKAPRLENTRLARLDSINTAKLSSRLADRQRTTSSDQLSSPSGRRKVLVRRGHITTPSHLSIPGTSVKQSLYESFQGSSAPNSPLSSRRNSSVMPGAAEEPKPTKFDEFDLCFALAKKYTVPIEEVKQKHMEFLKLDADNTGELSRPEFEEAIREHCKIPEGQEIPEHLVSSFWEGVDKDGDGSLDFEEYLFWVMSHEYTSDWVVLDETERALRSVAHRYSFDLVDVERVRRVFDFFDKDKSGFIDQGEFRECVCKLLGAKQISDVPANKLKRYWREVDTDCSGSVSLEEFVVWYMRYC